ncbi:MAG: hypothetical protein H0U52_05420 [Chloroflexi bacterium]|nr:hypothetical protein [Chloroflexota bacterium]
MTTNDPATTASPDSHEAAPRSRRALLAAAAGSVAGLLAARLGAPDSASAAAGDPLILGNTSNSAGIANTTLSTYSSGTALQVVQIGPGTGLRGVAKGLDAIAGFFRSDAASFGGGAAVRAAGQKNHGVVATASDAQADAVRAVHTGSGTAVRATAPAGVAMAAVGQTGLTAEATGTAATGVSGLASGAGGTGVEGVAPWVSGETTGVHGEVASPQGVGVRGVSAAGGGIGPGVLGTTNSPIGIGVRAEATAPTGNSAALFAVNASTGGIGVYGRATATTGNTFGVFGETSSSPDPAISAGVWGISNATTGYGGTGVYGQTLSTDAASGVLGWAFASTGTAAGVTGMTQSGNGTGVFGYAPSSPGIGVLGQGSGNGYGVYSSGPAKVDGNLEVTGTIGSGAAGFTVDHPLDPANRYLSHSSVESSDMKNIYDGVVTLDGAGEATVTLPDWFEALNRDVRYQLTPIGAYAPVFVRAKVKSGRFTIAGGKAGQEVSWQVTGIRKDAWADAHRIPVEKVKTGAAKGRYLHPVEHGQTAAKGIRTPAAAKRAIPKAPKRPASPA